MSDKCNAYGVGSKKQKSGQPHIYCAERYQRYYSDYIWGELDELFARQTLKANLLLR